jgi:hypothetical protein
MAINTGIPIEEAKKTWVNMKRWKSVKRRIVQYVMNLEWFRNFGLIFLVDFTIDAFKS